MGNPRNGRPRDSQRQKVYDAEARWEAEGFLGRRFTTIAEIQKYVDGLLASAYIQRHYGDVIRRQVLRVRVLDGRGRRTACARPGVNELCFPIWSRTESTVLHEVAHLLVNWKYERADAAWHGHQFAACMVELVNNRMGKAAGRALVARYKAKRVRYRRPRQLTDEQRAAMADRFRQNRALATAAKVAP